MRLTVTNCNLMEFIKSDDVSDDSINYQPKVFSTIVSVFFTFCKTLAIWVPLSLACLPFFLIGLFIWGLPPTIPVWSRIFAYFKAIVTEGKSEDSIPLSNRVKIFLLLLNVVVKIPVNGVCWFLDELLYPTYHKVDIKEPIFFLTATRSGSTQLCQYLEDDKENFIAPKASEALMPYIWYWKLFTPLLAKLGMKQHHSLPTGKEAKKRAASFSLLKAGTWDGLVGMWHFIMFSWYLGSSFNMKWGYSYAKLDEPVDKTFYGNLLSFTNHVVRKVVYLRGTPKQRLLLKIHFLQVSETLVQQYPKAKFFAVVRQPLDRFCSLINFTKVLFVEGPYGKMWGLFPPSWNMIRDYILLTQIGYCKQEMSFYKEEQENKLVIPFTLYVNSLSATLRCVYSFCDIPIPDHVISEAIKLQNTSHDYTKLRASYDPNFNRSLTSLGVDEEKVKEHLTEYIEWVNQLENCKKFN